MFLLGSDGAGHSIGPACYHPVSTALIVGEGRREYDGGLWWQEVRRRKRKKRAQDWWVLYEMFARVNLNQCFWPSICGSYFSPSWHVTLPWCPAVIKYVYWNGVRTNRRMIRAMKHMTAIRLLCWGAMWWPANCMYSFSTDYIQRDFKVRLWLFNSWETMMCHINVAIQKINGWFINWTISGLPIEL